MKLIKTLFLVLIASFLTTQHSFAAQATPMSSKQADNHNLDNEDAFIEICLICRDSLADNKTMALRCKHTFHETCINQWLMRQRTCPYCRAPQPKSFLAKIESVWYKLKDSVNPQPSVQLYRQVASTAEQNPNDPNIQEIAQFFSVRPGELPQLLRHVANRKQLRKSRFTVALVTGAVSLMLVLGQSVNAYLQQGS